MISWTLKRDKIEYAIMVFSEVDVNPDGCA
jgi:hypothetical protein